ncbi:putative CocE/NonD family hydrolase [Nocardioides zeae]|uniref:CocE/NonD family hydrolase n=1 Tax=Nocardioides zeae TaxID=1457234 RepID=A0ACC6II57_9ACTN|nr:CocE/NonD family hydrolase [Nocardioides zeae]MDR6176208.1 putative CocE/NonD family hydrolase [Nocardioides zeae]MDR6210354.1 putative CocE/NonD family hydrolase [Nocardioides zeae]
MTAPDTALVTGASSGIGEATARALARAGCHVVLVARRRDELERVAAAIRAEGGRADVAPADLRETGGVDAVVARAEALVGPIEALVGCAGAVRLGELHEVDDGSWHKQILLNVTVPFALTRAVLPGMRRRGRGWIVHVGSAVGGTAVHGSGAYGVSKRALQHLTELTHLENRDHGIHAHAVCPGWVATPLAADPAALGIDPDLVLSPEDVAATVVWLLERPGHVAVGPVVNVEPLAGAADARATMTRVARAGATNTPPPVRTVVEHDLAVPMRDGTLLRADVWRREGDAPRPVVLFRTPYDKSAAPLGTLSPAQCVDGGYAAVVQDTRGRFASDGPWTPLDWSQEGPDGHDTIEWIAAQPWCDGNVVMAGTSYQAIVQWLAAAERPPHLRAIAPTMSTSAGFDREQTGGALRLDHLTSWLALTAAEWVRRRAAAGHRTDPRVLEEITALLTDPECAVLARPVAEILDVEGFPGRLRDVVEGRRATMSELDLDGVEIPTLSVGGWFDVFLHGTVSLHRALVDRHPHVGHELVVGPWVHGGQLPQVCGTVNTGVLGSALGGGLARRHLEFFDRHVGRGDADGSGAAEERGDAVHYFAMGPNRWLSAPAWPPPGTTHVEVPLVPHGEHAPGAPGPLVHEPHPAQRARPAGDGASASVRFTYDADDPVRTHGGRVLQLGTQVAGPQEQSHLCGRADVVTWTSAPLTEDLLLVGRQRLVLDHDIDPTTTDLAVRLCDVGPDLRSTLLAEGHHRPDPLRAGAATTSEVLLGDTAWHVPAGHRLRLHVTCGNHPQHDRNPGLDRMVADGLRPVTEQSVVHGCGSASRLLLEVGPRSGSDASAASATRAAPGPVPPDPAPADPAPADPPLLDPGDPTVPSSRQCVVEPLLRYRARRTPDAPFAVFEDGRTWDYATLLHRSERTAAGLQQLGVRQRDHVLSWLPNGPDALRTWFGTNLAGAVVVPINVAYRGAMLEHVVADCGARILVTRPSLAVHLLDVAVCSLTTVVLVPAPGETVPDEVAALAERGITVVLGLDADVFYPPGEPVRAEDTQSIIYTSGTTGPSKGVLSSYAHLYSSAAAAFGGRTTPADRYLLQLPLFHAGGTIGVYGMLLHGASVAVVPSFRTSTFWDVVRERKVTSCTLLGVMASYLLQQPPGPADRAHPLREMFVIPLGASADELRRRFGVRVHALFNMTEVACPVMALDAPAVPMLAGRPRAGVEARVVERDGSEVSAGEVGELVLRPHRPWSFGHGYLGRPEATAAAWREGWFHTGDSFRQLPDGSLVFVDRIKDAIRRRGENISSFEVEAQALAHPAVREAAAVAVPCADGEDDVLLVVAGPPGGPPPDPLTLCVHLQERLAHFMVPRYVRVVDALPLTVTAKPRKDLLRAEGVAPGTWDREAAGLSVRAVKVR